MYKRISVFPKRDDLKHSRFFSESISFSLKKRQILKTEKIEKSTAILKSTKYKKNEIKINKG